MGLLYAKHRGEHWAPESGACLYCGGDAYQALPAVYWYGDGQAIILHGDCARKLGVHLIADSREAELSRGQPWRSRAIQIVRSILTKEESRQ